MDKYTAVIGLEIHVQLKTKSKMFCDTPNGFAVSSEASAKGELEKEPNLHICPVCTGQPGTLPVINEEAVRKVIKTGLALHCQIDDVSKFDRKNYFYPDLPKGYQISQYDRPLARVGYLEIGAGEEARKIQIRRIHLEEDTGKLMHPDKADYSLVDYNRAGVPLMELVTEPDIRSGVEAKKFCQELQLILRYLDISDADMEKGQMRCEVNISLSKINESDDQTNSQGELVLGTKVEIKNLNSFKVVERSVDYEIERQTEVLEKGEKVIQETRGWHDARQETFSQRLKEEAHDYRYFPEPDLPPLTGLSVLASQIIVDLPELPQAKRERFSHEFSLPIGDVEVFISNKELADYFEEAVSELDDWLANKKSETQMSRDKLIKFAANYLINELPRVVTAAGVGEYKLADKITPENFAEFIMLVGNNAVSRPAAQTVLGEMFKTGIDPSHIIGEQNLAQMESGGVALIVEKVITDNPDVADDYRHGKTNVLQFLVGQVMKETRGKASPQTIQEMLKEKLGR